MGCDTLVIKREPFEKEGEWIPPCHLARETATIRNLIVEGPVDEELDEKVMEIARKHDVHKVLYRVPLPISIPCMKVTGLGIKILKPLDDVVPAFSIGKRVVEEGEISGVKYRVEEDIVAICRTCPLFKEKLVHGLLAPPCNIRTHVYAEMMPDILSDSVIPLTKIDNLIEQVKSYRPRTSEEEEKKKALIEYLETIKKLLPLDEYVFFNWC